METPTTARRILPPVWLMGLTNCTWGLMGGFTVVTLPEMLAAQGLPGDRIGAITATLLLPGFFIFAVAPILDVRFSRRTYALATALLTAAGVAFTVLHHRNLPVMEAVMFCAYIAASLYQGAVGGWMGSLIGKEDDSQLGAWFAVANTGAGGVMMYTAGELFRLFPAPVVAMCLAVLLLLPTLIFLRLPAPGPDRRLASESFTQFFGELVALVRRREIVLALILFVLPSASFALTNVLGGVGRDFSASERLVSLSAGVGSAVAGVFGSLLIPPLARRIAIRPLYLGVGIAGGLFTLSLLLLPHTPVVFAVAITGENIFQAMAFAVGNAITFEAIGPGNPLAATTFSVLLAAVNLSIVYMGYLDSAGYKWRGITGSFLTDGVLSIAICLLLAWWLAVLRRREAKMPSADT